MYFDDGIFAFTGTFTGVFFEKAHCSILLFILLNRIRYAIDYNGLSVKVPHLEQKNIDISILLHYTFKQGW